MAEKNGYEKVETKCREILGSPYMSKRVPGELVQLRSLLLKVESLSRDDVPALIAEIKRLQAANREALAAQERAAADDEVPEVAAEADTDERIVEIIAEAGVEVPAIEAAEVAQPATDEADQPVAPTL